MAEKENVHDEHSYSGCVWPSPNLTDWTTEEPSLPPIVECECYQVTPIYLVSYWCVAWSPGGG